MNELLEKAKKVKCIICDVDGVLTNGIITLDNFGNETKGFNVQDGVGLKLLMSADIHVGIITTSSNAVIDHRMAQLGVIHYYKGQVDKRSAYQKIKQELGLSDEAFAYVGDDLPDLPLIRQVGLGVAVANAVRQVKEHADWQTTQSGGQGAVREVCDLILEAQGMSESALERYLSS